MKIFRHHFTQIDSTNTWGKLHAEELDLEGVTLVTADEQTAGRGRFKRNWLSPPGQNIYATFCFFIKKDRPDIGNIPQIMALAAAELLEDIGFKPKLKWPNDVMIAGKKVAGILCETVSFPHTFCVVLGIGLNVNMEEKLLQTIDRPATSLLAEDGISRDREEILRNLAEKFVDHLILFSQEGFPSFLHDYKKRVLHRKGDPIRFHDNRSIWEGQFLAINSDGSLLLRLPEGEERTFIAGEIL